METFVPTLVSKEITENKKLSDNEFRKLFYKFKKTRDPQIKNKIINSYMRLVISTAKKFYVKHSNDVELEDLIEEGLIGLMVALNQYKISKKTKFSTYATQWIQNKIQRYLKERVSSIQMPSYITVLIKKWLDEWYNIYKRYGRYPTIKEISKKLKISYHTAKKILQLLTTCTKISSLDSAIDEEGELTVGDLVTDKEIHPEEFTSRHLTKQLLNEAMNYLSSKEAFIVKLRFGMTEHGKKLSYRKIAKILHLTPERIYQIEKQALKKLYSFVKVKSKPEQINVNL